MWFKRWRYQQHYRLHGCSYLQWTVNVAEAVTVPTALSASQLYSPSSSGMTASTRRLRSSSIWTLPRGIFPPPAVLLQRTSGTGSPPTRHWNSTLPPASVTASWGPRIRNGFTVIAHICIVYFALISAFIKWTRCLSKSNEKYTLQKSGYLNWLWGCGLDLSGLGWEWAVDCYEHGNRPLGVQKMQPTSSLFEKLLSFSRRVLIYIVR